MVEFEPQTLEESKNFTGMIEPFIGFFKDICPFVTISWPAIRDPMGLAYTADIILNERMDGREPADEEVVAEIRCIGKSWDMEFKFCGKYIREYTDGLCVSHFIETLYRSLQKDWFSTTVTGGDESFYLFASATNEFNDHHVFVSLDIETMENMLAMHSLRSFLLGNYKGNEEEFDEFLFRLTRKALVFVNNLK